MKNDFDNCKRLCRNNLWNEVIIKSIEKVKNNTRYKINRNILDPIYNQTSTNIRDVLKENT